MNDKMTARSAVAIAAAAAMLTTFVALGVAHADRDAASDETARRALLGQAERGSDGQWASRTVWACDRRKMVVVEGVRPDEKIPPARAQLVADVLMDLMRYCNEEITAHIAIDQHIRIAANGLVYEHYVPGQPLPIVPADYGNPTRREERIWEAELEKLVTEGDRLFHSDELGTNGMACAMCHPHAAGTHPETYPKFQTQLKKVALLRDMVNWCIINPIEGEELQEDDPRMKALEAYILASRAGTPLAAGKH